MSFRSIGTLASAVLKEAELAAHRHERARELGGDGPVREGGPASPSPIARHVKAPRELNKKDRANPASGASRDYGREGENAPFSTLALGGRLKLVVNNCEPGQSRPIGRAFAPRRSGSHLLIVNNGVPH